MGRTRWEISETAWATLCPLAYQTLILVYRYATHQQMIRALGDEVRNYNARFALMSSGPFESAPHPPRAAETGSITMRLMERRST